MQLWRITSADVWFLSCACQVSAIDATYTSLEVHHFCRQKEFSILLAGSSTTYLSSRWQPARDQMCSRPAHKASDGQDIGSGWLSYLLHSGVCLICGCLGSIVQTAL